MKRMLMIVFGVLGGAAAQAQMPGGALQPSQGVQTPFVQGPGVQAPVPGAPGAEPRFGSPPPPIIPPQIGGQGYGAPLGSGTVAPLPQPPLVTARPAQK